MAHIITTGLGKSRDAVDREGLDFELDTCTGLGKVPGWRPRMTNINSVV